MSDASDFAGSKVKPFLPILLHMNMLVTLFLYSANEDRKQSQKIASKAHVVNTPPVHVFQMAGT